MPNDNPIIDKKRALLAYKQQILEEIQYYEKRIDEFPTDHKNNCYYDDSDSSDSEDYFPSSIDTGPDVGQLKLQQTMLKTCLQATQELTSLTVLQSEVNVLVQDPDLNGESPVTEPGTWKEVTAECRIDLVPFTITFYMHTPDRKFAPTSYRGLQVSLVKTSHEVELNTSVLHTLKRPSDAIEVVRSYAVGYRSRRTTLARLANKYASALFMEPHPEGGFVLKCANLLQIVWRLENKWSPVAPFHHRMKFDLEYMNEAYIKIITQTHKQLLDPTIQTDERSLLLAKIINVCLQAKGPIDSESDVESRQTDMRTDTESKDKDSEVMAPPKSLPKKTKKTAVKDKDKNLAKDSASQKRRAPDENDGGNTKKVKTGEDDNIEVEVLFKAKEKGQHKLGEASRKDKDSMLDIERNTKKDNEMKKTNNHDKVQQTNKNNRHDQVDVASVVTNDDNITEKNKMETNKNIAKKRNNNDKVSEITKTNKNDEKELKRVKSNEEIKRKNVQAGESIRATAQNINENNKTENNKNIVKKRNNNDKVSEMAKANENENKELKRMKSNEEIKKKNVETVNENNKTENKNVAKKNINNGNGPTNTQSTKSDNKELKKVRSNEEIKRKNVQNVVGVDGNIKNITKKKNNDENGPETTKANKELKKVKSNEEMKRQTVQTTDGINENNKIDNIKNLAKKRNNDNGSEMTKVNKNDDKEIRKAKSNEEIKRKNIETVNENNKNIANKRNNNYNGPEIAKTNLNDSKILKKVKSNEEIKRKINNKTEDIQNVAKKNINDNGPQMTQINRPENKDLKKVKSNEEVKRKHIQTIDSNNDKNIAKKRKNNENGPEMTQSTKNDNRELKKVKSNEEIKRKNIETGESHPKKSKSSTDINKSDKKLTKNNENEPNKINTVKIKNIGKEGINKQDRNNVFGNRKPEKVIPKTSTPKEKRKDIISKIPQKKISLNSETSVKSNLIRISPRRLPLKLKTISQDINAKQFTKSTNIPRFLKKTVPKTSK